MVPTIEYKNILKSYPYNYPFKNYFLRKPSK